MSRRVWADAGRGRGGRPVSGGTADRLAPALLTPEVVQPCLPLLEDARESYGRIGAAMLRMAAGSLVRGQTALGVFYRRLAVRVGRPKTITATARQLALLVYRSLTLTSRTALRLATPCAREKS